MSLDRVQRVLAHPLHQYLGMECDAVSAGRAALRITVAGGNVNPAGMLHGGALYTLCDVCGYLALCSELDEQTEAVTHDLHVSVLRPAAPGSVVEFAGEVVRRGRNVAFLDVVARCQGKIIAQARVTKSLVAVKSG